MRELTKQYVSNLEESLRLMKSQITPEMTDSEILDRIQADSRRLYEIRCENDRILRECVFDRKPESLTAEECEALAEMAEKCSHFANSIDAGVSYRIHRLLWKAAELHGDVKNEIRELYWQGIALYYLNMSVPQLGLNPLGKQMEECFLRVTAHFSQYEQLPDSETRGYVVRSMANRNLVNPRSLPTGEPFTEQAAIRLYETYMQVFRETMEIDTSPYYRTHDPDLAWEQYVYSLHFDRTTFQGMLRQIEIPYIAQDVMESAEYIYQKQKAVALEKDILVAPRIIYIYTAALFHVHRLTASQMMEQLLQLYHEVADPTDFSLNGNFVNLTLPQNIMEYFDRTLSPEEKKRFEEDILDARRRSRQYLATVPYNNYTIRTMRNMREGILAFGNRPDETSYRLLDSVLVSHTPTYVHSRMVAEITRELVLRLLDTNPAALEGTLNLHGVEALCGHREEIGALACRCGLYHDVGKSIIINYISIYGRSLLDEEFACIKLHPYLGYCLLADIPGFEDLAEAALHHHVNYNGKGGYPTDCPPCSPRMREIVNALTVADSTDAATDDVGRCYAASKRYDTLVEELFRFSGTRYAPEIVELFRDETFRRTLGEQIAVKRRQIYCEVYADLAKRRNLNGE